MKSFIKAITITIVLTLIPAGSTTAQITPAPAPTAPSIASQQAVKIVEDTTSNLNETLKQTLRQTLIRQIINARAQQYGGGKVLVIPTAEIKPQDLVTMMEDVTVMCRIFDKRLEQSNLVSGRVTTGSRIRLSTPFSRDSRSTGAMYIQGYGALFLTKVDFLLSPPPEAPEEKETEEEDTDPLWTQMRQEIYAPEEADRRRRTDDRPEEKYDADKVEDLKTTYIIALKHAANIRGLKPDESVVLTVIGKVSQSTSLVTRVLVNDDGHNRYITTGPAGAGSGSLSPTVLTIRAKKSDIDAFAKGQYDFDQFRQKTQLISYPYLGGNVGGPSRSSPTNVIYGGSSRIRRR